MGVIRGCCEYYGMSLPKINYACTLQIARKAWIEFKCHKLTYLAEQFGIEYDAPKKIRKRNNLFYSS